MVRVQSYEWGHTGLVKENGEQKEGWISKHPDSAGGVQIKYTVRNYGNKAVKKTFMYFTAKNGAFENVKCETTQAEVVKVSIYDPIEPRREMANKITRVCWYSDNIRHIHLEKIEVEYADGTKESCNGNYRPSEIEEKEMSDQISKDAANGCLFAFIMLIMLAVVGAVMYGLLCLIF